MAQTEIARDAGAFLDWLKEMRASLRGDCGTNVPCGDCVGCCVSSYFIPVRARDTAARAQIPARLLVRVSDMPPGDSMMGYLEDGTCPMLKSGQCSIYAARPQTCRDYDCRIFAAAGLDAGGPEKAVINRRVHAWKFAYPTDADRRAHDAVLAAANFIRIERDAFPNRRAPTAPTGIAVLAVKVYEVFLDPDLREKSGEAIATAIIRASAAFDAGEPA